ncbi:MAG: RagB/SusD family nutrient uptake outer membrane protein, partial [Gemmatimonadetes bacterium]|nr:RagB/SusD family nutrient uptake outer membrane protein [Gemmatimonadota bacterium]
MKLKLLGLFAAAALAAGCDDPLNVQPQQSLPREEALNSAEEIRVAVNGIYDALQSDGAYSRNLLLYPDLYTDNLRFTGTFTTDSEVFVRDIRSSNAAISGIWGAAYTAINRANNVLSAAPGVADLPTAEGAVLMGQARFIRALSYMNLVTLFGGVPLVLDPVWVIDPSVNVARASESAVWAQIEADLNAAIGGL